MSYETDILMHHGVKGQKWGVRKKSYSDVISGLSDKDFVSNSKNAYRISNKKEKLSNSPTYVTLSKKDRANYIVGFSFFYDKMYSINMKTTSKMISPSERKRVEAFVDLYKNDPAVKKSLVKDSSKMHMVKSLLYKEKHFDKMYSKMDDAKLATKAYKDFSYDLTFNKDLANKYIEKFKAQGYNSLIDDHDALNNMSKNPLIVFDPAKHLKISNYQTISDKDKREALKLIREKGVNHMDNMSDTIEHHGIKGQKWGVRRYKEARSSGINASKMNQEAAVRRYKASKSYVHNTNEMNKNIAKRDAARHTSKVNEYDSKAKAYSYKRNAAEKDYNNADKDVAKYAKAYESALKEAANQNVEIKKHTLGRALVMGAFRMPYRPSSKDTFDEDVMTYRSVNHVKHSDAQSLDSIEHHGVKGMKWGQRKATRITGTNTGSKHQSSLGTYIQTRSANKARAKQWRSQYNNRGEMSTEDLRRAVNRLNLENQFDAATKQAMASSSQSVFSKYKQQYINGAVQGAVNNTNQVGNRVGQAAAKAMVKRIGMAAAASV